jgi:hypothetical protein
MSNSDIELIKALIHEVASGARPYSRETLRYCYLEHLSRRNIAEAAAVSEKWIDHFWNGISSVPFEQLARVSRSDDKLARLLMEKLGK